MKKVKTPLVPTAKVVNSNSLRIRRRSVANLTENQMGDAAGGHPHHTCEPTCPATCCPTCPDTCPRGCPVVEPPSAGDTCRGSTCDTCDTCISCYDACE